MLAVESGKLLWNGIAVVVSFTGHSSCVTLGQIATVISFSYWLFKTNLSFMTRVVMMAMSLVFGESAGILCHFKGVIRFAL